MIDLHLRLARWLAFAALALSLSACVSSTAQPYTGPVYPAQPPKPPSPPPTPQVVYRIDDHRYFELTPDETCFGNMLYFVDTAKGIRSEVVAFDAVMNRTTLIIDAANDQYLVAPVTRGSINCSSGGGGCGDKMPYSTDGGRTWKRVWSPGTTYALMVSGSMAYQSFTLERVHTDGLDLTLSKPTSTDWTSVSNFVFKPRIAPIDTKVRCSAKPEGSQR